MTAGSLAHVTVCSLHSARLTLRSPPPPPPPPHGCAPWVWPPVCVSSSVCCGHYLCQGLSLLHPVSCRHTQTPLLVISPSLALSCSLLGQSAAPLHRQTAAADVMADGRGWGWGQGGGRGCRKGVGVGPVDSCDLCACCLCLCHCLSVQLKVHCCYSTTHYVGFIKRHSDYHGAIQRRVDPIRWTRAWR